MAYITYDQFKSFGFALPKDKFEARLTAAELVLDAQTRNFYQYHDLDKDTWPMRADKFRKALSLEIMYLDKLGVDNAGDAMLRNKNEVTSQTIGRTSVSYGNKTVGVYNSNQQTAMSEMVSPDVAIALSGTGLLYRGVDVVW